MLLSIRFILMAVLLLQTSRKRSYPSKESTDNVIRHDLTKRPSKNAQFRVLISNLHPSVTLQDIEVLDLILFYPYYKIPFSSPILILFQLSVPDFLL